MHVLQVITTLDVGGAEYHLLSLCRGLAERGHRVDVIDLKGATTLRPAFQDIGIEPKRAEIDRPFGVFRSLWILWRLCSKEQYEVVHTHLLKANVLGAAAARLAGIRNIVASKHNDEPQLRNSLIAWIHRRVGRLDKSVLHASRHIERYMVEIGGVASYKSTTLHYGIDAKTFASAPPAGLRRDLQSSKDTVVVACVARLIRRKGHITLLEAFSDLVRTSLSPLSLWIVGRGPMEVELRRRVEALEIEDSVFFIGERSDIARVLQEVDVFVLASETEGLGLVLLEAMAASLPVIATRVGGIPEIVVHDQTGLLVQPNDPSALATALRRLCCDPSLRNELGDRGHQRVVQEFSIHSMIDRVLSIYQMESSS